MTESKFEVIKAGGQMNLYFLRYENSQMLLNSTFSCTRNIVSNCSVTTDSPCLFLDLLCNQTNTNPLGDSAITANKCKNDTNSYISKTPDTRMLCQFIYDYGCYSFRYCNCYFASTSSRYDYWLARNIHLAANNN